LHVKTCVVVGDRDKTIWNYIYIIYSSMRPDHENWSRVSRMCSITHCRPQLSDCTCPTFH